MKRFYVLLFFMAALAAHAQVGIGTNTPDPSAKLDVTSTNKGFLPPRVALTATNAAGPITNPAQDYWYTIRLRQEQHPIM